MSKGFVVKPKGTFVSQVEKGQRAIITVVGPMVIKFGLVDNNSYIEDIRKITELAQPPSSLEVK